jgi:aldehyde:ferredoxin oxidoreductase
MVEEYGTVLKVDLERGRTEYFTVTVNLLRRVIGGTGLGAQILYDEVAAGTHWSDPQNRLIIAAGPLNATSIGGSGSVSVVTQGPLTNGASCSQANGYFGAYLRQCGLVAIVVYGIAPNLQYLHVTTESAELKDADWLQGMDTYQTSDLVKHELKSRGRNMSVASIGPAGENLVKFAGLFFDYGHSASHNGPGAVMGSKKLKAIAIARGNRRVVVHNANRLREIAKQFVTNVKSQAPDTYQYGTLNGLHNNAQRHMIPVKNYTTNTWIPSEDKWEKFTGNYIREKFFVRKNSCWACQIHHCDIMKITTGPYAGEVLEEPEYEQFAAWSSNIGQENVTAAMMLSKEVDRLGLENNEAGWVVGFAMECYERGILTDASANNIDLTWGNAESARLLLNLISKRQGIGDILAEGVMSAAKKLNAEAFAIHTLKGNTPRGHDHRNRLTEQFDTCISNTGTLETWGGPIPLGAAPKWEDIVAANLHDKGAMMFEDSLVTCRFNTRMNVELLSQALSAVTSWDFTWEEGIHVGRRIVHLLRAFNIKQGIPGRELDRPSTRYGSVPAIGPSQGRSLQKVWDKLLDDYYAGMGWDCSGKPLPETLEQFELADIVTDM